MCYTPQIKKSIGLKLNMDGKQVYDYNLSCLERLIHIFIFIYGPLKHESACNLIKIFEWSDPFTDQVLNMSLMYGN